MTIWRQKRYKTVKNNDSKNQVNACFTSELHSKAYLLFHFLMCSKWRRGRNENHSIHFGSCVFVCVCVCVRNEWRKNVYKILYGIVIYNISNVSMQWPPSIGLSNAIAKQLRVRHYAYTHANTHTQATQIQHISRVTHYTILCTHKIMHAFLMNLYIYYQIKSNQIESNQ